MAGEAGKVKGSRVGKAGNVDICTKFCPYQLSRDIYRSENYDCL